jgi:DNA-binding beta-propeller fold protein YncE
MDLKNWKIHKRIPSASKSHRFVMTPDGKKVYTTNKTGKFISVLDLENEGMHTKAFVPGSEEAGISLDGRFVYLPTPGVQFPPPSPGAGVQVIDITKDEIITTIKTHLGATSVHVTPAGAIMIGKYCFESGGSSTQLTPKPGRLALYDGKTYELLGEVEVGLMPLTLWSSADGKTGFVANILSGTVTVVDLTSMSVVRTLEVDTIPRADKQFHQGAHGMAFIP